MLKKETMKKQFLRVKQLANQNFGRAEKSEVLSDELLQCEKKIETLKHVSHNTTKKLSACLQGQGQDFDKRLKKLPDSHLAASMMESSQMLGNNSILGSMLATCGECQQNIAKDKTVFEMEVEAKVLEPLNKLAEVDIPNVYAQKKRLGKATLDMDSARSRHLSAVRATTAGRSNLPEHVAKIDQLKEEMEEASSKMASARDSYVTDLLALLARESEYSEKLVEFVEEQAKYHKNAAANLDQLIPAMRALLLENPQQKVFGTELVDHLRVAEREIAFPIEACCEAILQMGVEEEGLFRIAGASSKVKKLRASFDVGIPDMADFIEIGQVHAITGMIQCHNN
uniref:Rho GTPase-activating protein 44-like n=1 Tax=Saccoglossus kowalevskii TaxID=10224 RepID=A0ABM0LWD2_SACKO|nr:PREDICTED: rho GTPase-activating protein 44-like [Saccoglossus kowalevskii]